LAGDNEDHETKDRSVFAHPSERMAFVFFGLPRQKRKPRTRFSSQLAHLLQLLGVLLCLAHQARNASSPEGNHNSTVLRKPDSSILLCSAPSPRRSHNHSRYRSGGRCPYEDW